MLPDGALSSPVRHLGGTVDDWAFKLIVLVQSIIRRIEVPSLGRLAASFHAILDGYVEIEDCAPLEMTS